PTTSFFNPDCCWIKRPNAAVNFTMSIGVNASPGRPPMVPRIPEMDLINVMWNVVFKRANLPKISIFLMVFFGISISLRWLSAFYCCPSLKFHQHHRNLKFIFTFVATLFNLYDRPAYFFRPGRVLSDQPRTEQCLL